MEWRRGREGNGWRRRGREGKWSGGGGGVSGVEEEG